MDSLTSAKEFCKKKKMKFVKYSCCYSFDLSKDIQNPITLGNMKVTQRQIIEFEISCVNKAQIQSLLREYLSNLCEPYYTLGEIKFMRSEEIQTEETLQDFEILQKKIWFCEEPRISSL